MFALRWFVCGAAMAAAVATAPAISHAQGTAENDFEGHPRTADGHHVFAAYNPDAGSEIADSYLFYGDYDHPNLRGWDFRINLPHVRFQPLYQHAVGGVTLAGVIEEKGAAAASALEKYHHVDNAIWALAVGTDGVLRVKRLPSRRRQDDSGLERNVRSLSTGWEVASPSGVGVLVQEAPAVYVEGVGLGDARIHVAVRTGDGLILHGRWKADAAPSTWSADANWYAITGGAVGRPAISRAADAADRIVIAWPDAGKKLKARPYRATTGYGATVDVYAGAEQPTQPQLVYDGTALDLFFIGELDVLQHRRATSGVAFQDAGVVGGYGINSSCDVVVFDRRFHVACSASLGADKVWYTTSTTPLSAATPTWEPAVFVGLNDHVRPRLGIVGDQLYVIAIKNGNHPQVQYARRNPMVVPFEYGGSIGGVDEFLEVGSPVSPSQVLDATAIDALSFNNDIYLSVGAPAAQNASIVNFSRAALKRFLQTRWKATWRHGGFSHFPILADGDSITTGSDAVFQLADVDGDRESDLVRYNGFGGSLRVARSVTDAPGAPHAAWQASSVWLSDFTNNGDRVLVGDMNHDGRDDLVRLRPGWSTWTTTVALSTGSGASVQPQTKTISTGFLASDGLTMLGDVSGDDLPDLVVIHAGQGSNVMVARGQSAAPYFADPEPWLTQFAGTGWKTALGDVDGDGRKDLIGVVTSPYTVNGTTYPAPVFVSISTGSQFALRQVWREEYIHREEGFAVGDFDLDGSDDLVRVVRGQSSGSDAQSVYVAFAQRNSFAPREVLMESELAGAGDTVLVGDVNHSTKGTFTGIAGDERFPLLDLIKINASGAWVAEGGGEMPLPLGLPHERYRFFTEKALGVAAFPDSVWGACATPTKLYLRGAQGVGMAGHVASSVRPGGTQGHLLEEAGHALFDACVDNDALIDHDLIFSVPLAQGGFAADSMHGCNDPTLASAVLDCRDPEHYFLRFMLEYRLDGGDQRAWLDDPTWGPMMQARYDWLRDHWYDGVQFHEDDDPEPGVRNRPGLQCLPGLCDE